ncbi:MAG: accessory factor UbiK family protein [Proteobacteria bacterium]|nr:accessory factor UbiK family protein [Pseudomonadota bacterium]
MIPDSVIDQITEAIGRVLPQGMAQDARQQLNAVLASRLEQLGLVSREEFDVQQAVLERLRERLTTLEAEFAELQQTQEHKQD